MPGDGADGLNGWSPVLSIQTDGGRKVLQITDWAGGEGIKPANGSYIGSTGFVSDISDAIQINGEDGTDGVDGSDGADGAPGADGADGTNGTDGTDGDNGWTPSFAIATDSDRRVLQVSDWVGGEGTKPDTGDYVGAAGLVPDIADGVDIRGPAGASSGAGPMVKVYLEDPQEVPNSSLYTIDWDAVEYDEGSYWDAGDPDEILISQRGIYRIIFYCRFASWSSSNAVYSAQIRRDRSGDLNRPLSSSVAEYEIDATKSSPIMWEGILEVNDIIKGKTFQDSGGPLDLEGEGATSTPAFMTVSLIRELA